MSIVKADPNSRQIERPGFDWEREKTLVEQQKSFGARLRRFFTFWRIIWIAILLIILLNEDVALFVRGFVDQLATSFLQFFAFDLSQSGQLLVRLVFGITIAIGQFALIFWFLGRARMYTIWPGGASEGVGFKDYRGQPELLDQAKQIVTLLRGVRVFEESGGEPLTGLLLEGPPGTGKTWMAQAISTEAGVPFFYLDASSLQSMFMGIAPLKVSGLYSKARKAAKDYGAAIIFMDEIDAIGARPGVAEGRGDDHTDTPAKSNRLPIFFGSGGQTGLLSTLLVEMDGFSLEHGRWARWRGWWYRTFLRRNPPKPEKRILTIGATNRIQALDKALLRPGRFDRKIRVDAPDMEGRRDIYEYYLSKYEHDDTLDPLELAADTPGYTPADIKYLLNESLRYALFQGRAYITATDFYRAQPEHEYGLKSPIRNMDPKDRYRLAAHEAGHAIAIRIYEPDYRIARITIIRQGGAHGYVLSQSTTEKPLDLYTYDQYINRLRISVAGKAAEMEFAGEGSQTLGVGGDFMSIRAVMSKMAEVGMFGPIGVSKPESKVVADMQEELFLTVLHETREMIRIHRTMGDDLINVLLEREELLAREVEAFFDRYGLYTPKIEIIPQSQLQAPRPAFGQEIVQ